MCLSIRLLLLSLSKAPTPNIAPYTTLICLSVGAPVFQYAPSLNNTCFAIIVGHLMFSPYISYGDNVAKGCQVSTVGRVWKFPNQMSWSSWQLHKLCEATCYCVAECFLHGSFQSLDVASSIYGLSRLNKFNQNVHNFPSRFHCLSFLLWWRIQIIFCFSLKTSVYCLAGYSYKKNHLIYFEISEEDLGWWFFSEICGLR